MRNLQKQVKKSFCLKNCFDLSLFEKIVLVILEFQFSQSLKVRKSRNDFFKYLVISSKKQMNEFYFTTMKPQVDLFSFGFFGGN